MKVGIAGFSGCGKTTVFQWLTGKKPDPAAVTRGGQVEVADFPDERVDWLSAHFKPKSTKFAKITLVDLPGLDPRERRDNPRRLAILRDANGLLVVLNGFGSDDLAGELRHFREELIFADLELVMNRVGRLEAGLKKPRPQKEKDIDQAELDILKRVQAALESGRYAATVRLSEDEDKTIRSLALLTLKPEAVLVNIGDTRIGKPLPADLLALAPGALQAPAKLELELRELPDEDRQAFMQDLGLSGFSAGPTLRAVYYGMGMIVFLTCGEDECRAWNLRKGADAVEAAAQVHTDLAAKFNRARVVSFEDFRRIGSMKDVKEQGLLRLEGKTYVVQDGDIIEIL
jgi:ribosome-binding ATPase YchF (GTP1/OBG family)